MKSNDFSIQTEIFTVLQNFYNISPLSIEFIPMGEESYSYAINTDKGKYFVKYCEQEAVIKNIDKVNTLLTQLKYLPFVVPPIEKEGKTSFEILKGKVYVYPYIEGKVVKMGNSKFDTDLVEQLTKIMADIHNAKPTVDLPIETFKNDFTDRLEKLKQRATEFDNEVKELLFSNNELIKQIIDKHNLISNKYLANPPPLVLTHGDITGLNIIQTPNGIKLVDWDRAMFAPAERDINFLYDNPHFSVEKYLELTHREAIEDDLRKYYGQDWALNSIIGNFESILDNGKSKANKKEYIDEINEYLSYYK